MPHRVRPVWSPAYACDIGPPVSPTANYAATIAALRAAGDLPADAETVPPPPATRALLAAAHDAEYLDDLAALRWTRRTQWSELPLTRAIVESAMLGAAG